MPITTTQTFVDQDKYDTRLVDAFCRLDDAVQMTVPVLGPQDNLGGTDADIFDRAASTIEKLAAAWPRIDPTLDEVRNGEQDIEGAPVTGAKCKKGLREQLEDAYREHGCSPDMAKVAIEVLRARRRERTGVEFHVTDKLNNIDYTAHSNLEPIQRAHFTRGYHTRNVTERARIAGYSVQMAVMDHYRPRGEFGHDEAQGWLADAGYNPVSDSPAMFYLVRDGFCKVIQDRPRRWRFEKPLPAGYVFDFADKHGRND